MVSTNSSHLAKNERYVEYFQNKIGSLCYSSRQALRDNVEHTSIEEYYRCSIFLPFFESLLQQINRRFQGKTKDAIKGMYLIPSNNKTYE